MCNEITATGSFLRNYICISENSQRGTKNVHAGFNLAPSNSPAYTFVYNKAIFIQQT